MRRFILMSLCVLFIASTVACINNEEHNTNETIKDNSKEETISSQQEEIELPDNFVKVTNSKFDNIIDVQSLTEVVANCLDGIGVDAVQKMFYGNYEEDSTSAVIDVFLITDINKRLLMDLGYRKNEKSPSWYVREVRDVDTNNSYYAEEDWDLYDYKTGKPKENDEKISKPTKKPKKHRKGMYGISNKDIHDVGVAFRANKVRNDVTGNWRISTIAENIQMVDYALSYYEEIFIDDNEIHAIVNFNYNTTTNISILGNMLDVTVHEYVDGEEHDANLLFSGTILHEYHIYLDNGDIKEIQ